MNKVLGIVVLGGGVGKDGELNEHSKLRYDKALQIYKQLKKENKYNKIYFITSSKKSYRKEGNWVIGSEAEVGKQYIISQGILTDIVLKEEQSQDTLSNAFYIKKLLTDPAKIYNLVVVTSKFHIAKAKFVFGVVWGYKPILKDLRISGFNIGAYKIKFISAPNPTTYPIALKNRIISEKEVLKFYKKYLFTVYGVVPGNMETIENFLLHHNLATSGNIDKYQQQLTNLIKSKLISDELLY